MEYFSPSSQTVSFFAESCLLVTVLFYVVNLKHKSHDTYLYIGYISFTLAFSIIALFFNSQEGLVWLRWLVFISWVSEAIYRIMFAYYFHNNPFGKEIIYSMLIATIVLFYSSFINLKYVLISHLLAALWTMIVFCRKIFHEANNKQVGQSNNGLGNSEKTYRPKLFFRELLHPSNKIVKAYKGFLIWAIFYVALWILFILQAAHGWDLSFYPYTYHALLLIGAIQSVFVFINYAKEKSSLEAKLVWIILCAVLIILALLPYALFGDPHPTKENPITEPRLWIFFWLTPLATALTVFIAPIVFRYNILHPLQKVVDGVKRVNDGDLSANVKADVNDEIGILSDNFNQMTESLSKYASKMEELVDQRTAQLKTSLDELKSTQSQLIQSEKMASLGELTAGIAHEIQNPLNFVNNFSEVNQELIKDLKSEIQKGNFEEVNALANDIESNEEKISHHGKRADAIVKSMLQHSRTSSGKKQLTDINALCDEYLRLSYHGLRAKDKSFNAKFETHLDPTLPKLNVIPQDIGRVLLNLINNAFYAVNERNKRETADVKSEQSHVSPLTSHYEPTVTVSTKSLGNKIEISVKDNGNGIPGSIKEKIFQPFFTTKPTGQGTGLGLSLSYDIVKAHGGELKVETKHIEGSFPGVSAQTGSEFIFQLQTT